jgi:hypothetical protein
MPAWKIQAALSQAQQGKPKHLRCQARLPAARKPHFMIVGPRAGRLICIANAGIFPSLLG